MTTSNTLPEFIAAETRENIKASRLTWIIGLVIMALVTCYMSGILILMKSMLDPQVSAIMIRQQIESEAVPALLSNLEDSLKMEAPKIANALSKGILASFSSLRTEAEEQITLTHQQFLPLMQEEIWSVVKAYASENEDMLRELYSQQKVEGFTQVYVDELTRQIIADLDSHIVQQSQLNGLKDVEAKTLAYLEDVQNGLESVMSKPDDQLTRSERLQRRLIVAWLRIFEEKIAAKGY